MEQIVVYDEEGNVIHGQELIDIEEDSWLEFYSNLDDFEDFLDHDHSMDI